MESKTVRTIGVLLVGGVVGAGAALLFAPQSGKRTRRDLRYLGKKALNRSESIAMDCRRSVENIFEKAADRFHWGVDNGRSWSQKAGQDAKSALKAGKDRLQEGLNRMRSVS
jgi:gas vesicle protein